MMNKKSLSNENIFRTKNWQKKSKFNNNIISLKVQDTNNNDIKVNYLSSVNNIFLSNKFNFSNLKSVFLGDNENHVSTDMNKVKNKNLGNVKIMKENKSNLIYSLQDIKKKNKNYLPNINSDKNKIVMGKDYINKFLFNTIKKRNLSNSNLDDIYDNNDEKSYKNQFLKLKKHNDNNINKI